MSTPLSPDTALTPDTVLDPDGLVGSGSGVTTPVGTTQRSWRFYLANSNTLARYGEFTLAHSRTVNRILNRPGSCSLTVSMDDPLAALLAPVVTCIVAEQDGIVRYSGPVWTLAPSLPERSIQVGSVGWFETLRRRTIRDTDYATTAEADAYTGAGSQVLGPARSSSGWSVAFGSFAAGSPSTSTVATANPGGIASINKAITAADPGTEARIYMQVNVPASTGDATLTVNVFDGATITGTKLATYTATYVGATTATQTLEILVPFIVPLAGVYNLQIRWTGMDPGATITMPTILHARRWAQYGKRDIGDIALSLVDYATARDKTWVLRGTAQTSWQRTISFKPFSTIGEEIQRMSDVENGYDFDVDPATKQLNIYYPFKGTNYVQWDDSLTAHQKMGATALFKFDSTTWATDSIGASGSWTNAGTPSLAPSLESYDPNSKALYSHSSAPAGLSQAYTGPISQLLGAGDTSYSFSVLLKPAGFPAFTTLFENTGLQNSGGITVRSIIHGFYIATGGALQVRDRVGLIASTSTANLIASGTFAHIVGTWNAQTNSFNVFLNGAIVLQTGKTSARIPPDTLTAPATYLLNSGRPVYGGVDEYGLWAGRCISGVEAYELYQTLRNRSSTPPQGPRFGYGSRGQKSLRSVRGTTDVTHLANWVAVTASGSTSSYGAAASDRASVSTYGAFDAVENLSEVASADIVAAYAGAEIAVRSKPFTLYDVQPLPWADANGSVPRPFVDYDLGDIVSFDAKDGTIDVAAQSIRIFGIAVTLDDNGQERVQLTYSPGQ